MKVKVFFSLLKKKEKCEGFCSLNLVRSYFLTFNWTFYFFTSFIYFLFFLCFHKQQKWLFNVTVSDESPLSSIFHAFIYCDFVTSSTFKKCFAFEKIVFHFLVFPMHFQTKFRIFFKSLHNSKNFFPLTSFTTPGKSVFFSPLRGKAEMLEKQN